MRILVTGSRRWTDTKLIHEVLEPWFTSHPDAVLVHGAAVGADTIAKNIWVSFGGKVEPHRADWSKYGKAAGPIRNREMVEAGADVCLAFMLPDSTGTADCVKRAKAAGIKTYEFQPRR